MSYSFFHRRWQRVLAGGVVFYTATCLSLVFLEPQLLYQPFPGPASPQEAGLPSYTLQHYTSMDGLKLPYWEHRNGGPLLIYLHGNGGGLHAFAGALRYLNDHKFHVVAMEYRGFSGAPGKPSETALVADAVALVDALKRRYPGKPVVIWGYSLGSGIATQLAVKRSPSALVLEAPFTSAVDRAEELYPLFPVRQLMRNQYRSQEVIDKITAPVFIMHGTDDTIIPMHHSETLFAAANEPKRFQRYEGFDHMTLMQAGAYDDAVKYIRDTLKY